MESFFLSCLICEATHCVLRYFLSNYEEKHIKQIQKGIKQRIQFEFELYSYNILSVDVRIVSKTFNLPFPLSLLEEDIYHRDTLSSSLTVSYMKGTNID